jgi:predicted CoA-binding protein
VLSSAHRIAVIGIKPETVGGPAYYVPAYLQAAGFEIVHRNAQP